MEKNRTSTAAVKIREIMTANVTTIEPEERVFKAVKKMVEKDVECLPVTKFGILRGLVTFRDIIEKVVYRERDPEKIKVEDVMTKRLITCGPDSTIIDVVKLMKNKRLRRIPVVDESKKLIGIVTNFDLAIFGWELE